MELIIYPYWILKRRNSTVGDLKEELIIYPYWILKTDITDETITDYTLIIYPYWILKLSTMKQAVKEALPYNLSILDFKVNNHITLTTLA